MRSALAHSISAVPCRLQRWQVAKPCLKDVDPVTIWEAWESQNTPHFLVSFSSWCAHSSSHLDQAHPVSSVTFSASSFTWPVVPPRCDGKRELKKQATINTTDGDFSACPQHSPYLFPTSSHCHNSGGSGSSNTWAQAWDLGSKLCFWLSCWSAESIHLLGSSTFSSSCRSAEQLLWDPWTIDNRLDLVKDFSGSETPKLENSQPHFCIL